MISIEQKFERHRRFWDMDSTDRPLIGFTIGDYFPSRRYQAAQNYNLFHLHPASFFIKG